MGVGRHRYSCWSGLLSISLGHIERLRGLLLLSAFWAGVCLLPAHGVLFGTPMLSFPVYGAIPGRASMKSCRRPRGQRRIVVSRLVPVGHDKPAGVVRARLLVDAEPPLAPGDVIEAKLRLAPIPGPVLPGAFDSQFHGYFAGIGAYGNVTSGLTLVSTGSNFDPTRVVEGLRRAIADRISVVLTGSPPPSARPW